MSKLSLIFRLSNSKIRQLVLQLQRHDFANKGSLDTSLILVLMFATPWAIIPVSSELLFPYVTSKVLLFRSLVEVAFMLWLVRSIVELRSSLNIFQPLAFVFVAFVAWVLLVNNLGISPYHSFWSNYERMDGGLTLLHYLAFFLVLRSTLNSEKRRHFYSLNLVLMMMVVGYHGLQDVGRADAILGNPIYLGNLAVAGFFFSGFWIYSMKFARRNRLFLLAFWLLLATFFFSVLVASATRGSAMGLIAGMLIIGVALVLTSRLLRPIKVGLLVSGFLCLTLGSSLLVTNVDTFKSSGNPLLKRLAKISLDNRTTVDRIENWRIALSASEQSPWLGWGQENYSTAFLENYRPLVMDQSQVWFDRAHNYYLDWLVAAGYPGLLLFLLLWIVSLYTLWRVPSWSVVQKSFLLGLVGAYLVRNLVGFDSFSDWVIMLSVLSLIASARLESSLDTGSQMQNITLPKQSSGISQFSDIKPWKIYASLCMSLITVYYLNVKPWHVNQDILLASRMFNQASDPNYILKCKRPESNHSEVGKRYCDLMSGFGVSNSNRFRPISALLSRANDVYPPGSAEAFELFSGRVSRVSLEYAEPSDSELVTVLLSMSQSQLNYIPQDWRLLFNTSVLYSDMGQNTLATQNLKRALQAAPSKTIFWLTLAKIYVRMNQFEKAKDAYNQAYRLNSAYPQLANVYALVKQGYKGSSIIKPES